MAGWKHYRKWHSANRMIGIIEVAAPAEVAASWQTRLLIAHVSAIWPTPSVARIRPARLLSGDKPLTAFGGGLASTRRHA